LLSIKDRIIRAKHILIAGHAGPDFDSAGSCLGLYEILKGLGKEVSLGTFFREEIWQRVSETAPVTRDFNGKRSFDLVILLDYGKMQHVVQYVRNYIDSHDPCVITIDNHPYQDQQGDVVWVEEGSAATAEMVYDLARFHHWFIGDTAAFFLLLGIIAESGALGFYPIGKKTLHKVMRLVRHDDDLMRIAYMIRGWDGPDDMFQYGAFLKTMRTDKNLKLIYGVSRVQHPKISEIAVRAVHEAMFVKGYTIMFFLRSVPGSSEWYCSLRGSKDNTVDLNLLAARFGGGGHFNSAGFKSSESSATIINKMKVFIRACQKRTPEKS